MERGFALVSSLVFGILVGIATSTLYYYLIIPPQRAKLEPTSDLKEKVDTFIISKVDTLYLPLEIEKRIVDTIYVQGEKEITPIPVEQKVYQGEHFKAYISGYRPTLDSLYLFSFDKVIERQKPPPKWNVSAGIDLSPFPYVSMQTDCTIGKTTYGAFIAYNPINQEPFIGVKLRYTLYSH